MVQAIRKMRYLYLILAFVFYSCNTTDPPLDSKWEISGPILFVSNKSGSMQLYSMKMDGTGISQLTNDPDFPITYAKWSPDGSKIALSSYDINPNPPNTARYGSDIYVVDADGTNKYKLTGNAKKGIHYGSGEHPNWSFDSKLLVFSRLMYPEAIGNTDLYLIDIDSGNEKRVTSTNSLSEMYPSFSCNNSKILSTVIHWYTTDHTGNSIQHYTTNIIDLSGNTINEYGEKGEGWYLSIWSADCSEILFTLSDSLNDNDIYSMNKDGKSLNRISSDEYRFYRCISWSENNLIIYNATNTNYYNKIYLLNLDENIFHDITPFEAEIVEAASINLNYDQ